MRLILAGFILSLVGSLPPGLISLSVAQTSIARGWQAGIALALGAAFAEFFQAWVAIVLTDWFLTHHAVIQWFNWFSIPVFLGLGIYLIFFAPVINGPKAQSQRSILAQFGKGILLSAFNLLAIPYWFVYCGWLKMEGWWQTGPASTLLFSAGVMAGTIFALSLYAWLGQWMLRRSNDLAQKANRFIGFLFLGLSIKILWTVLRQMG